jgi:uncharacterized Tic20 family protein
MFERTPRIQWFIWQIVPWVVGLIFVIVIGAYKGRLQREGTFDDMLLLICSFLFISLAVFRCVHVFVPNANRYDGQLYTYKDKITAIAILAVLVFIIVWVIVS